MRVAIEGDGFGAGVDVCLNANQIAVLCGESLSRKLEGCAGMAGDDATSVGFAAAYDAAAASALGAIGDLGAAFAGVGVRVALTGARHGRAEEAAYAGEVVVYDGLSVPEDTYLQLVVPAPVSVLGVNEPGLSAQWQWVLDRVEGFVWPGADVARVRDAARVWRVTAGQVDDLGVQCELLLHQLARQRSPEIPVAVAVVEELRGLVGEVVSQVGGLASVCEEYADRVEAAHAQVEALLGEVVRMVVEGVVIGVVVSAVTAGAGAGVAVGATVARIARESPRFTRVVSVLRAATAGSAVRVRYLDEGLVTARQGLVKFARQRRAMIDERGSFDLFASAEGRKLLGRGFLSRSEKAGGHTIEKHVGKSMDELLEQMTREGKRAASSYRDIGEAERIIRAVLSRNAAEVDAWVTSSGELRQRFVATIGDTGISVTRDGQVTTVDRARVVLERNDATAIEWRILTSFPQR